MLEHYPAAWAYIVSVLCERLRRTSDQLTEVALLHLSERLAKVLLRMMTEDTPAKPGRFRVQLLQRELGELIGATRESVNKCLRSWQSDGILTIEKGRIIITNRAALEQLIEQS